MMPIPGLNPGHGTRTGSVMMSQGGISMHDTTGPGAITGVAPGATYVPKRCIRSVVVIFAGDIAQAVWHSTTSVCHVVSMSLGGRPAKALRVAIQDAVANHLLVVAAAGNKVPGHMVVWPAAYPECIALAATNEKDAPWSKSSRGRAVDVSAPGDDVWVAEPTNPPVGINVGSGTSYATAHTAGVAALWLAFHDRAKMLRTLQPGVFLQEVFRAHLRDTARVPGGWDASNYGSGIVDARELLDSSPSIAVPLGFGQAKQWSIPSRLQNRLLKLRSWLGKYPIEDELVDVFEHELSNLALDDGEQGRGDAEDRALLQPPSRMSQTLRRWLHG
jgi:subtilisin family serine protease